MSTSKVTLPRAATSPGTASAGEDESQKSGWKKLKTFSKLQGNARAVVFAGRLNKASFERGNKLVGSLKSFVPEDILGNFKEWIEYPDDYDDDDVSTKWSDLTFSPPMTPSQASNLAASQTLEFEGSPPSSPGFTSPRSPGLCLPKQRRRPDRVGDRLMRQRMECPRLRDQLKPLVPQLPPDPPELSRAARKARAERLLQEAEKARQEAQQAEREARRGFAKARFRAAGFAILRKLRLGDEDFFTRLNNTAVLPLERKTRKSKEQVADKKMPEAFEPFYHHLRHVRREELSPRRAAKRDDLTNRGNFSPSFIADLAVKPRVDSQPLLAFMEEGDFMSAAEQKADADSEHQILSRRLRVLRSKEARGDPNSQEEIDGPSKVAKRSKLHAGAAGAPVKFASSAGKGSKMQRMIELLDPGKRAGYVMADALVPLMFWLGLTKSRMSALETLRMGFGSLQIDTGALLVMGEHVEVQMRLVEGLRHLSRRDSLDQLCEYITGNSFQRLRAWFNSMRSDQFGCVDITQVQSLFARMEVTTDRQTLFRLLSYIIENPHPTAAKDPREAMAIEKKKFSLHGFGSLLCRCAASWVLHRVMSMLEVPESNLRSREEGGPTEQDIAMRWIQLQRKIMISLMVNQRFWGRECRQVLSHLQPPQVSSEEMEKLSPELWNLLFQRVRAQGLASVLPHTPEEEIFQPS